jgi:hypothetical protein
LTLNGRLEKRTLISELSYPQDLKGRSLATY